MDCLEEALYAEFFMGIDIESYLNKVESNEACCHHGIGEAIRNWWCSPAYEIDRSFYKAAVDIIKPLLLNGVMETSGFSTSANGGLYDAEVTLNLEYYINGEILFEFRGADYHKVLGQLAGFVNGIDIAATLKNPPWYEIESE